jgi:hexosaminidase
LEHRAYNNRMLQRIAGPASPEEFAALRTLADVVEPVKDYTRAQTAQVEATSLTPMNRLVDAVPLESDASRRFGELVDKFVLGACHDADAELQLRAQLTAWRENDARLATLAQRSYLVKEVTATSQDLSALGITGLAAVDFIAKDGIVPDTWKAQQLAVIQQIQKPKAQLLLMPAPAVQKLVEAATAGGSCGAGKQ